MSGGEQKFPTLIATVLDALDARELAEFYLRLLGYTYRPGDEMPPPGEPDLKGQDWLVLFDRNGIPRLSFQQVDELPAATWPEPGVPMQLHLDFRVDSAEDLEVQRQRALELGAELRYDRTGDPDEPLYVFADPAGHPFCILASPGVPAEQLV